MPSPAPGETQGPNPAYFPAEAIFEAPRTCSRGRRIPPECCLYATQDDDVVAGDHQPANRLRLELWPRKCVEFVGPGPRGPVPRAFWHRRQGRPLASNGFAPIKVDQVAIEN